MRSTLIVVRRRQERDGL